jgi:hypothetical protein
VQKDGKKLVYVGNLIYAAIFSDKDTYECNVKRLLYRDKRLVSILKDKAELMNLRGCNTALISDLGSFETMLEGAGEAELDQLSVVAEGMQTKQEREECKLW